MSDAKTAPVVAADAPVRRGSLYPEPFASLVAGRSKQRLGDLFGLTQFGVNLTTLPPGCRSSLRHYHTREDELVYVLSGELVLITDAGEQPLRAGMVMGFPAGSTNAHHLLNRSSADAQYLEVGSRIEADFGVYPDDDLEWVKRVGGMRAAHKDGTPY